MEVQRFDDGVTVQGVSEHPIQARGIATVKIRLGTGIVFEMNMWVVEFEAGAFVILGTDFMVRAGVRLDMGRKECALPDE